MDTIANLLKIDVLNIIKDFMSENTLYKFNVDSSIQYEIKDNFIIYYTSMNEQKFKIDSYVVVIIELNEMKQKEYDLKDICSQLVLNSYIEIFDYNEVYKMSSKMVYLIYDTTNNVMSFTLDKRLKIKNNRKLKLSKKSNAIYIISDELTLNLL